MDELFGSYRVVGKIAEGALTTLYKAEHVSTGRTVVVKALSPSTSPTSSFAAQIDREANVLSALSHSNIVLLIDFVPEPKKYLVLEYIDGFELSEIIAKLKLLPTDFALAIAISVVRAIGHASARGIVHRDVKPKNILISRRGEVKLADFGIAQRERLPSSNEPLAALKDEQKDSIGEQGLAFGTPQYMSPEQILGDFIDVRSDLFSLGVVLYEMLSGTRPFDAPKGEKGRGARSREAPPPPLLTRAPNVSRDVERVVMRLMERHPADRYETPSDVEDDLTELLRRRTKESVEAVLKRGLFESGLIADDPKRFGANEKADLNASRPMSIGRAYLAFAAIGVLFLILAGVVESVSWRSRESLHAGAEPLPLVPSAPGFVKVLAVPWADVAVDGEHFDTTPFAKVIPLREGIHFLTFTHPDAPIEKREVRTRSGETTTVEVIMQLHGDSDAGAVSPKEAK